MCLGYIYRIDPQLLSVRLKPQVLSSIKYQVSIESQVSSLELAADHEHFIVLVRLNIFLSVVSLRSRKRIPYREPCHLNPAGSNNGKYQNNKRTQGSTMFLFDSLMCRPVRMHDAGRDIRR